MPVLQRVFTAHESALQVFVIIHPLIFNVSVASHLRIIDVGVVQPDTNVFAL